jgi:hypothetical protein
VSIEQRRRAPGMPPREILLPRRETGLREVTVGVGRSQEFGNPRGAPGRLELREDRCRGECPPASVAWRSQRLELPERLTQHCRPAGV